MPTPALQCAQSILAGLPSVMWSIRQNMRRHRQAGLSVPQFRILGLLDHYPRASLACVCEHLGCTAPTGSRLVTRLIAKKLVVSRQGEKDRRQVSLLLTPRGAQVLEKARMNARELLATKVEHLSDAELKSIEEAMGLLGRIFTAQVDASKNPAPKRQTRPR
ncbi:MAG: MarR family winged helix-turn-helix transcriptional regulator [Planctomycetota bacterium]|nr:MarR family winged helix-turn-helix transcriptional regulator [Planctomycetota bacterium]